MIDPHEAAEAVVEALTGHPAAGERAVAFSVSPARVCVRIDYGADGDGLVGPVLWYVDRATGEVRPGMGSADIPTTTPAERWQYLGRAGEVAVRFPADRS